MKRRFFLLQSALLFLSFSLHTQETPPFPPPPEGVSSTAIVAPSQEPGERLLIHGTVYHADGSTPYTNLIIYLYQTDSSGVYNHENRSWRTPRLRGWVKTGERGTYEIQSIKPGSYPGSRNPAHIHAIIKLPGREARWIDDFLFYDDPFIADEQRLASQAKGKFANIMRLEQNSEGHLLGRRDIKIEE